MLGYNIDAFGDLTGAPQVFKGIPDQTFALPRTRVVSARPSLTGERPDIAKQFSRLVKKWREDTHHLSAPADRYLHPNYARIIGLVAGAGKPGLEMILRDLRDNHNDWFFALRAITGENPVTDSMAGDVPRMVRAWVQWGQKRGCLNGSAP